MRACEAGEGGKGVDELHEEMKGENMESRESTREQSRRRFLAYADGVSGKPTSSNTKAILAGGFGNREAEVGVQLLCEWEESGT